MAFTEAERRQAAAVMSSDQDVFSRRRDGSRDLDALWEKARCRLARTVISDPDVVFYWAFLSSNRARKRAIDVAILLEQMIAGAEGRRLQQQPLPDTTRVSVAAGSVGDAVASNATVSRQSVRRLRSTADDFVRAVLPSISQNGRLQQKGQEAASSYSTAREALFKSWTDMRESLLACTSGVFWDEQVLRTAAVCTPAENLDSLLQTPPDPENASAYTLYLLAGVSAVDAMSREVAPFWRVRVVPGEQEHPPGVSASQGATGGVVTAVGFQVKGSPVDPTVLGLREGDLVRWGVGTAVLSPSQDPALLSDSTIAEGEAGPLQVYSPESAEYLEMRQALRGRIPQVPEVEEVERRTSQLEGASAAETRDLVAYLASLVLLLHEATSETSSVLARLGAEVEAQGDSLAAVLLTYDPTFRTETQSAGKAALDYLRSEGFTRAESLLLDLRLPEVLQLEAQDATYSGRLGRATSELSIAAGRDFIPTTLRRVIRGQ